MTSNAPSTREERLAAQLRENLHRRKAQGRAIAASAPAEPADPDRPGEMGQHLPKATPPR